MSRAPATSGLFEATISNAPRDPRTSKGYGFAILTDGREVLIHASVIRKYGITHDNIGEAVQVCIHPNARGDGVCVSAITRRGPVVEEPPEGFTEQVTALVGEMDAAYEHLDKVDEIIERMREKLGMPPAG